MIRLERLVVADVHERPGRFDLVVERDGSRERAVAYAALTPPPVPGDVVICNTTSIELGLGTGGVHFVLAIEGRGALIGEGGHAIKGRYLPVQVAVDAVEDSGLLAADALDGARVVVCPLHSLVAPVAIAVRSARPSARIVYVMTDQAALALPFSDLVGGLRDRGLVDATITTGQAFGGDIEAVTIHSGLLAARHVARADVIVVAMGPGNLGTSSRYGFSSITTVADMAAVRALGGDGTLCARISFADRRERHRGLSHHTRTVVELDPFKTRLALPLLEEPFPRQLTEQIEGLDADVVWVDGSAAVDALERDENLLRSMGRGRLEDPAFFLAGVAAGLDAVR